MTPHHVAALLIAALMYIGALATIACIGSFPPGAGEKVADHAFQLAMAIVIGIVGHAGAEARKKSPQDHGEK